MTRLAALDLGSNSFHLLVADSLPGGRIRQVETQKITLRLAEPVARTGELGKQVRQRAVEAFAELLESARAAGARRVVALATEALRKASDGAKFRDRVLADHGVRVRTIEGLEEAQLGLRGMVGALARGDEELLGLDMGGGSYEVAFGGRGAMRAGVSLPLGAARLGTRSFHDPLRLAERVALHVETTELLTPLAAQVCELRGAAAPAPRTVGTAGTIRDLGRLGLALAGGVAPAQVRGLVVTRDQLERGLARLVSMPTAERMELPGINPRRADLLPAGGVVLLATLEAFGLEQMELCDWGLREGALLDALDGGTVVTMTDFSEVRGSVRTGGAG